MFPALFAKSSACINPFVVNVLINLLYVIEICAYEFLFLSSIRSRSRKSGKRWHDAASIGR